MKTKNLLIGLGGLAIAGLGAAFGAKKFVDKKNAENDDEAYVEVEETVEENEEA